MNIENDRQNIQKRKSLIPIINRVIPGVNVYPVAARNINQANNQNAIYDRLVPDDAQNSLFE